MKNKEIKKNLILNGEYKNYTNQRHSFYKNQDFKSLQDINSFFDLLGNKYDNETFTNCEQIRNARHKQITKLKDHFVYWYLENYQIYFITFTYDTNKRRNKNKSIKPETLKSYITRYLKQNVDDYVLNVDYGTEHERLHYHALIAIKDKPNLELENYRYTKTDKKGRTKTKEKMRFTSQWLKDYENKIGFYQIEKARTNGIDITRLTKYIDKLTLHSIKVKQSYVGTMKGTQYQREKEYKKQLIKRVKYSKLINKNINFIVNNSNYKDYHNQLNGILETNKHCEIEYEILNNLRISKENELKEFQNTINQRKENSSIFDIEINQEYIEKLNKNYEIYKKKQNIQI